ncbi:MAG TPA: pyridoxamine 5'-phosphate oxidase family protein [Methanomassiliicoccales archaeon]|nr:pyridoxamine 5'-phosphate oxidase family protein [Methanomassiliicoccales archaeon]
MTTMRRKEKEVCSREVMERLLESARIIRIGLCDGAEPYVVPMLFGYSEGSIFLHSAREGRKIDLIKKGGMVCFEVEEAGDVDEKDSPCKWTMDYVSVIGWGQARILEDRDEMREGLDVIMRHYGGKPPFEYGDASMAKMAVIRIDIATMTCKRSM